MPLLFESHISCKGI